MGGLLAELCVDLQKLPSEIIQLTRRQARLLHRTYQARQADRLHALAEIILAGVAPTASKEGAELYNAVRASWQEAAEAARGGLG